MTLPWTNLNTDTKRRAVAYYRHSAQDRQENSVEIQQDQVRQFAVEHSIRIIREFIDRGKTGLCVEGRDAFNEMLGDYVQGGKEDFSLILVLDVSRWGRFQEVDLSAYYTGLCLNCGKQVVYTTLGFPKKDDLLHGVQLSIERYRAASYSLELSGKVWKGAAKIASIGYWAGGPAPYGMRRLLLDENRIPIGVLRDGEHKAIHNQRVILAPCDNDETAVVRTIFDQFTSKRMTLTEITTKLNFKGIPSPSGGKWAKTSVLSILHNKVYCGAMVWNRTRRKLKSRVTQNPPADWIERANAFQAVVPVEVFDRAQQIFRTRKEMACAQRINKEMLAALLVVYQRYGTVSDRLVRHSPLIRLPQAYRHRFYTLDCAYQLLFQDAIDAKKFEVMSMLKDEGVSFERCEDFIVIDNSFSLTIQPCMPVPHGYEVYWSFRPDRRAAVDLTIGVPLSCPDRCEILGYLMFPRLFFQRRLRFGSWENVGLSLWAYPLVALIQQLRRHRRE